LIDCIDKKRCVLSYKIEIVEAIKNGGTMHYYQNQAPLSVSDNEFVTQIEQHSYPGQDFNHQAHVRLAACYFWRDGFAQGLSNIARTIQSYACSLGAPDKFHATVTYACYRIVAESLLAAPEVRDWQGAEPLLHSFCHNGKSQLSHYYSDLLLASDAAKQYPILPDKKPFISDDVFGVPNFEWREGRIPLVISMPHNGTCIPPDIAHTMTPEALQVKDTDWYLRLLYHFAVQQGCYLICPQYSRYVIDLNRSSTGEVLYPGANNTELCPTSTFAFEPLYQSDKTPDESEIKRRIERYWKPYHSQLDVQLERLREQYGQVLLLEAHSIASQVPRFFDGILPEFNFGTNDGRSCGDEFKRFLSTFNVAPYQKVIDARFKGGYITRKYGQPAHGIHSIQLELSQATYMDEEKLIYSYEKAQQVQITLRQLIDNLVNLI
jgi:N-formylglutamate deformylase